MLLVLVTTWEADWGWFSACFLMLTVLQFSQGEKDWQKYETARRLKKCVDRIRNQYREDWKSKEMKVRQRAVALYFIDKVRLTPSTLPPLLPLWDTQNCCQFLRQDCARLLRYPETSWCSGLHLLFLSHYLEIKSNKLLY